MVKINRNTTITGVTTTAAVQEAVRTLIRDIQKTCMETAEEGCRIRLCQDELEEECYRLQLKNGCLEIQAGDEMGFIYGLYGVSREILGIQPFWFWNDQQIIPQESYSIEEGYEYRSKPFRIRYRGWFVNDEVLLHTWSVNRRKEEPWKMAFEALLRVGGNLVIPGTDKNSRIYCDTAARMGLIITHHHSQPMGAEMFARAYPNLTPSFEENSQYFLKLWKEAIGEQRGQKVLWNLGFRGQGDVPFWENDPRYQTDEARGTLMSELIQLQYDMVKEADCKAVCSTNLYGETMELYKKGMLKLPKDMIQIWADNGFGKMVTRRQENHNPRIYALPKKGAPGKHGIYYHVSFYDLQAANHMTMLPNPPEFIKKELLDAMAHGADEFWIINCSNVKPHVYYLDFIAQLWQDGDADVEKHRKQYVETYYGKENAGNISRCFAEYFKASVLYGEHEDDHAGEQFSNHVARMLVTQFIKNRDSRVEDLLWATEVESLKEQVLWYEDITEKAVKNYQSYVTECEKTASELEGHAKELFEDSVMLQAKIHFHCFRGADYVCRSLKSAFEAQYQKAFYYAGKAREDYQTADTVMREREHGKWNGFYANECLTDMKQSAWVMKGFMAYVRTIEDGPHYYKWQREFLYAEEDRRVMLVMNMENHLEDLEIYALMKEKWE